MGPESGGWNGPEGRVSEGLWNGSGEKLQPVATAAGQRCPQGPARFPQEQGGQSTAQVRPGCLTNEVFGNMAKRTPLSPNMLPVVTHCLWLPLAIARVGPAELQVFIL